MPNLPLPRGRPISKSDSLKCAMLKGRSDYSGKGASVEPRDARKLSRLRPLGGGMRVGRVSRRRRASFDRERGRKRTTWPPRRRWRSSNPTWPARSCRTSYPASPSSSLAVLSSLLPTHRRGTLATSGSTAEARRTIFLARSILNRRRDEQDARATRTPRQSPMHNEATNWSARRCARPLRAVPADLRFVRLMVSVFIGMNLEISLGA